MPSWQRRASSRWCVGGLHHLPSLDPSRFRLGTGRLSLIPHLPRNQMWRRALHLREVALVLPPTQRDRLSNDMPALITRSPPRRKERAPRPKPLEKPSTFKEQQAPLLPPPSHLKRSG
ncbi:hypothetical protein HPB47_014322 [Ixodes persulcatus]|uniref:Uncharacterized protein n=1 Tax=Ixodes persulcatus TaxID=34615 RepID=A0AC60QXN4_IXOPE|nr:hypothetical protein HPB47_014322 [Ixodes persulcatus]